MRKKIIIAAVLTAGSFAVTGGSANAWDLVPAPVQPVPYNTVICDKVGNCVTIPLR